MNSLAAGLLYGEGIVQQRGEDIEAIESGARRRPPNVVNVRLIRA